MEIYSEFENKMIAVEAFDVAEAATNPARVQCAFYYDFWSTVVDLARAGF